MTSDTNPLRFSNQPDSNGRFGEYGGKYVAETLMSALADLEAIYRRLSVDPDFQREFDDDLAHYVGRPSPLYEARRMSDEIGGARILLKREDLNHTGAHKVNNTIGQALLAKHMGKPRVIAETGAGQHGVATATVAARLGLECHVFMGAEDVQRQSLNVYRMKLLGATVVPVTSGSATLKDAMNEAMRDWVTNVDNTFYIIGTVAGPHPYPMLVRDFQCVIGREARLQAVAQTGKLPDALVACVGGFYDPDDGGGLWVGKDYAPGDAYHRDPVFQISHGATAFQVARFYYMLETGTLVGPESTELMYDALSRPGIRHKFVQTLGAIPGLEMMRKSGTWRQFHSDSALVRYRGESYILVGLAENENGGKWLAQLARPVHDLAMAESRKARRLAKL